jgi:peptidylprolyl isomerase
MARGGLGARAVAAALAVGMVLAVSACTAKTAEVADIVVTGEPGALPEIDYETPLVVGSASVEVIVEGTGPSLEDGGPVLVNYYSESGADGSLINETYSSGPHPYLLSPERLGLDIYRALSGQRVGSRILSLVPPAEGETASTVTVFDILPTRASGEAVQPREGLPTVEVDDDGVPTITVPPDAVPPADLVIQPLVRGTGPQVAVGQVITVQYVGVRWSDGGVFDSTWAEGVLPASFPIGVESVVAGWDTGLVEQPVGSQVLLVVPPALGYGGTSHELSEETLVFVIDILSAVGGPAADGA